MEQDRQDPERKSGGYRNRGILIWLVVFGLVAFYLFTIRSGSGTEAVSYTRFKNLVQQGKVQEVTVAGDRVRGTLVSNSKDKTKSKNPERFSTVLPSINDPNLISLLETHDVTIRAKSARNPWWVQAALFFLPWILIIGLIVYSGRRMQKQMMDAGGAGTLFGFGRSRAKRYRKDSTGVTLKDVAGLENAKADLREIIEYLKNPGRYRTIGAKLPKGVLLMGPPGTGKTLLARACAGEAEVPFYSISGSEFIEMFVGVGAARVRDMFESARKAAPAIIFIDEIDSVGRARGTGLGGGHDEREQTLNQILSQMDGFLPHEAVVVIAATNRPDVLDPALLRPGRFDRKITMELPQRHARKQILMIHSRRVLLAEDVDLDAVAAKTVGFSGADLENLVNEAALLAGRARKDRVDMAALNQARDRIILGAEREDVINDEEKKRIAYHEAGHALVAYFLPHTDPLDKITIIPRGRALGVTQQIPEERHTLRRGYLLDQVAVMLGGRASENLAFGEVSSGAENDLQGATRLSRQMICRWGMSETLGPVSYRQGEEHVFLGREMAMPRDFSEHTARLIDDEIRGLIVRMEEKAVKILKDHRKKLDGLAAALLERETLYAREAGAILEGDPVK